MIIYLDSKIKVDTVIILDEIKPEMKIKIEKIINLTEELRKKKQKSEAYVKVLFCGNFNYGNFNYESLTSKKMLTTLSTLGLLSLTIIGILYLKKKYKNS